MSPKEYIILLIDGRFEYGVDMFKGAFE